MMSQWCIRVPLQEGEDVRRRLIAENLIDRTLRPRVDSGYLLIPILQQIPGCESSEFIQNVKPDELPRHEQIGGIVILQERDVAGAKRILLSRQSVHTALFATSPVEGEFRTRKFEVLAGESTRQTMYHEYGKTMLIDLSAAYFSARLANERQRILKLMQPNERVLDMFSGVGPFPIILSEKATLIVANDLNPEAIYLMQKNIKLNHISNVIPMLGDAMHLAKCLIPMKFDRIIMNLPMNAIDFLNVASLLVASSATIHLYSLVDQKGIHNDNIYNIFPNAKIHEDVIRSYSPTSWHAVYDITV